MPHLDIVTYLTQYTWTLGTLLLLFSLIVLEILPKLQQQLALRAWAESSSEDYLGGLHTPSIETDSAGPIIIFKSLFNLGLEPSKTDSKNQT